MPDNYYSERGTEIHRITQLHDETGYENKDHEWYGYLKAWIKFKTENEAFDNFNEEVELILNWCIVKILQGKKEFSLNDSNGNKIGFCLIE